MGKDNDVYFGGATPLEHGAFSFCYSWSSNDVIIHTPTRYAQATRDYFKLPIVRNYLNYGILTNDIYDKMHILQMLAYVVNHDRKHIYEICESIRDTKCIVLTGYNDTPALIEENTLNGAIVYDHGDKRVRNWSQNWYENGPQKPLIMTYGDYIDHFQVYNDIPVHIVDTPLDGEYGIENLIPFKCELHIHPVMDRLYSCLFRIADSHEEVYLEQVDYAIKTCIPNTLDFDEEIDAQTLNSLKEKLKSHKAIIEELNERLSDEYDLDFIMLVTTKLAADRRKFHDEFENISRRSLERADKDFLKDVDEMRMAYHNTAHMITEAKREAKEAPKR